MSAGFTSKCVAALRQTLPICVRGDSNTEEMLTSACWHLLSDKIGFMLYPVREYVEDEIRSDSIEYAQMAYECGYDVILADGRFLGYQNGMPS